MTAARTTVRVHEQTREALRRLAEARDTTIAEVVRQLAQRAEDERLLEDSARAFARLRADPDAWADYQAEARAWETTLSDGLDDYPWDR